ncbi:MAG: TfoX/Sxy family protein [Gemmatimonadota bacterium]|nr:TfoX/Sxy family protein [Gemmatimonadota bacterium]MDH3367196.1 TfoX/Sxy family protein [Gemmatimonadota bacterium]MDH3479316.1 TfoX/Sxy family protein [Gemmatimonadota bacterium]MDH3570098.1 TfoX/Sxy family protein [Gemmatimonadota bacterium]MDH5548835.1 TfoX/Sxy family protein [Gemmatimonadota bacterium]
MAYDETLAARVRTALANEPGLSEKHMFGGLSFLLNGNMCCGIVGNTLMVRVGPEAYTAALAKPHAREMDFTGRPLRGMTYVAPDGVHTDSALAAWVRRGTAFAASLPPKKPKKRKRKT